MGLSSKDEYFSTKRCMVKCSLSLIALLFLGVWSYIDAIVEGTHFYSWIHRLKFWTNWLWAFTITYILLSIQHCFRKYFCGCLHYKSGSSRPYYCQSCSTISGRLGRWHQVVTACTWQISLFYWIILKPHMVHNTTLERVNSAGFHVIPILFLNLEIFLMDRNFSYKKALCWDYGIPVGTSLVYCFFNFL